MTAALPRREPGYTDVAANGCTAPDCGTQDTATLDARHGRRCGAHAPAFDPTAAVHLAMRDLPAALAYIRTDFPEVA